MKQKIDLPVGQKVRGYGLLNEYGEFEFLPEQKGCRRGRLSLMKQADGYSLSSTRQNVIIHICFPKGDTMTMVKQLTKVMSNIIMDFKEYVF